MFMSVMAESLLHMPRRAAARFRGMSREERLAPALIGLLFLSGGVLAAALFYQFAAGIEPCKLCIIQRYPHYAVLALGAAGLAPGAWKMPRGRLADLRALILGAAGIALAVTGGYGVYHTGAERGWWPGPADCTGSALPESIGALNALLAEGEAFVRCDEVPWSFLGLSMASYNALISFTGAVFVIAIAAAHLKGRMSGAQRSG